MAKGILGKKVGMTQVFTENGELVPVTVIDVTPNVVMQIKTVENDGYSAVQLGFDDKREVPFGQIVRGGPLWLFAQGRREFSSRCLPLRTCAHSWRRGDEHAGTWRPLCHAWQQGVVAPPGCHERRTGKSSPKAFVQRSRLACSAHALSRKCRGNEQGQKNSASPGIAQAV